MSGYYRSLPCIAIALHVAVYATFHLFHSVFQNVFPLVALFLAQYSLLFIWGGLGTGRWRPRLVAVYGLAVLTYAVPLIVRFGYLVLIAWSAVSMAVWMAAIIVPLAIARTYGFGLQRFGEQDLPKGKAFQTSLRALLIVTVVVACLLAFGATVGDGSRMREGGRSTSPGSLSTAVMLIGMPTVLLSSALLSVWAALSAGTVLSRMVAAIAALAAGGAFLPYCLHGDTGSFIAWAAMPPLNFLIICLTLLAFRSSGYRFVRPSGGR
ncbi:MAG: hypothetical protein ACYC6Y_06780 [Thermoguttaceae bacterium]